MAEGGGAVTYCGQESSVLAAHALGALDPDEAREVDRHLAGCERCRTEFAELAEVRAALDALPPEALLDGPPEDGELLLRRTLRAARIERGATGLPARLSMVAAAVLAVVAVGAGVLVGRGTAPQPLAVPSAATVAPPGTEIASATDPASGARLTVRVEPAAGWVRVHAAVTGIPAGQRCRLVVVGRDGTREVAGSWLVSPTAARDGTTLEGSALVAPAQVAAVLVENVDGHRFVTVNI
jgi:anti-sigma factor RsiW